MCGRVHTDTVCPGCVGVVRANLAELDHLVRALPVQAVAGRQAYHHHQGVPGGDALVLMVAATRHDRWPATTMPDVPGDPRPPLDVLARWVRLWLDQAGQVPDRNPVTVEEAVAFLDAALGGLARHPLFPDLAHDVARTLHQVENVVHAGVRPEVSRVPCWDCGARLHKVWAEVEADDHWRCPACGEVYDHGRYERAKRDHLWSRDADRFVTVPEAVGVTGRTDNTIRSWAREGLVGTTRAPTGRLLVWWPDVRDRDAQVPRTASQRLVR